MRIADEILREMREIAVRCDLDDGYDLNDAAEDVREIADEIEAAVKALEADRDNWRKQALEEDERANLIQSVTNCNQLKDVPTTEKSSQVQTMDKWPRPLTNVCKCGNNQEAKPCATVKDANGVVVLHFIGAPWRSNEKATAMATDFCERVNNANSKPPRNIDKINDYGEMVNAWNDYVYHRSNGRFSLASFFVWLFDKAKGEAT